MTSNPEPQQAAPQRAEIFELPPYWHRGLPAFDGYGVNGGPEASKLTDTVLAREHNLKYEIGVADIGLLEREKTMLTQAIFSPNKLLLPEALCGQLSLMQPDEQQRPGLAIEVGRYTNGNPRLRIEHASFVGRCLRIPRSNDALESSNDCREFRNLHRTALRLAGIYAPEYQQNPFTPAKALLKDVVAHVAGVVAAEFALKNGIPVLARESGSYRPLTSKAASQRADAPVAEPFVHAASLVNVCNLSTALRHGKPFFSAEEIVAIARQLSSHRK